MVEEGAAREVLGVRPLPGFGLAAELGGVWVIWKRELVRFFRNRARILTSLVQPILFLLILGTGLSQMLPAAPGGFDYRTFMFPGILAMTVLFTSVFSAVSIVWDREFGFLREVLVAPISRVSVILGKILGGASVATLQGTLMLALAGVAHVPYSPGLLLGVVGAMAVTALAMTAFGALVASWMAQVESFQMVMQFFVMPMFFLSGAVFPLGRLPRWLEVLTRLDPLSYAVDPIRRIVFQHLEVPRTMVELLNPGITWGNWKVPLGLELALVAAFGILVLGGALAGFARSE